MLSSSILVFSVVDIFPNYKDFLIGSNGWGTVHFENQTAFTRLLLVWRDQESKEVQVTHSNFDYSKKNPGKTSGSCSDPS